MSQRTPGLKDLTAGKLSRSEREQSWRIQIKAQKDSGLGIRKFCEIHSLNINTFQFWQRKVKLKDFGAALPPLPESTSKKSVVPFTALKIVSDEIISMASSSSPLTVKLPGGAHLEIDDRTNIALAAKLLSALRGL